MSDYTAISAKIHAMYGKLLTASDYDALLAKHSIPEIASYLKTTQSYGTVLLGLNEHMLHRGQLEELIERDLVAQTMRLYHFMTGDNRKILSIILLRYEKDCLLAYLRHLLSGAQTTFFFDQNEFVRLHSKLPFDRLSSNISIQNAASLLSDTMYGPLLNQIAISDKAKDYPYIEKKFTEFFFERIDRLLKETLPKKQADPLLSVFLAEKDFLNLERLFRLKKYYPSLNVSEYLLSPGLRLNAAFLEQLSTFSLEELKNTISETYYSKYFAGDTSLDDAYYCFLWDSSAHTLHSADRSLTVILAYIHLKQIELHNLTTIIEGTRYGRSADQIQRRVIGTFQEV